MPTASTYTSGYRAGTYGTSYNTSSTLGRSSSATRRQTSSLSNGYASPINGGTAQYQSSRSIPTSLSGRNDFSLGGFDTTTRRTHTPPVSFGGTSSKLGPLKADHSTGLAGTTSFRHHATTIERTSDYVPSLIARKNSRSGLDGVSGLGMMTPRTLSARRSSSLANLHLDDQPSSRAARSRTESTDRGLGNQSSSRRSSRLLEEDILGGAPSQRPWQSGIGDERRDTVGNSRSGYTPSMSRESSPGTSNGVGTRGRHFADVREDVSGSRFSSRTSSSSTSSGKIKEKDGGKVGLRNLGNTCFMNSVLQCLSNTRPLLEWCLKDSYLLEINNTTSSMKGSLIKAFAALLKSLWKDPSTESYVSPNSFKTQIQKFAPRFMGYAQQDSQEFLRYLLEGIHEDVNLVTVRPKPIVLDDNRLDSKSDAEKAKEYWNAYLTRDNSHIVDIFVGQLKSELKFEECGHRSVTFDPFWDLSLPIPKSYLERSSDLTLDACLRLFMKEEEMEAGERPLCSKCKVRRSCTKSFSIQRFPQILVIHLKRFSQERYGRKLTSLVDFPVKGLNLSDYSSDGTQKVTYDLYAVSEHSGGVHSGHYTAICKNPYSDEWHTFNDTQVSRARSNQAVSSEAYLLFYQLTSPSSRL